MNILVTGGSGYLGGNLCKLLRSYSDNKVFSASRKLTKYSHDNEIVIDWLSQDSLRHCCTDKDVIIHLAAMNAQDCLASPIDAIHINVIGTANLLRAAQDAGVKRFVYISTAHVYGSPLEGNITEDTLPFPIHPYATSHLAAEDLVLAAHRKGEIEGVVLRLSNAFGAPRNVDVNCWSLLFNDLCRQAILEKKITLNSTGMQRRDFVPVTDVCRAICHMLSLPLQHFVKPVFNVGGNWAPTVFEAALLVADRIELKLGYRPMLHRLQPLLDLKSSDLRYCIDRLSDTGFCLTTDRLQELDHLIEFCKDEF